MGGKCADKRPCHGNKKLVFKNGKCTPKEVKCRTDEKKVDNKCVRIICKSDELLLFKKCRKIKCPAGKYLKNRVCIQIVCKKPKTLKGNQCVSPPCLAPNMMVNGKCTVIPPPPKIVCKEDQEVYKGVCRDMCNPDQVYDMKTLRCKEKWQCWDSFSCQARYKAYITEYTKLLNKTDRCRLPKTELVKPTGTGKKTDVKPSEVKKPVNVHVVKPSRRAQALVQQTVVKPTVVKPTVVKPTVVKPTVVKKDKRKCRKGCKLTKSETADLYYYKKLLLYFSGKLLVCSELPCKTNFTCNQNSHKCEKIVVPKCSVAEILKKGKCTPKCKESETYNSVSEKCEGCKKGTIYNKKTKGCVKIVIPKCPQPTIRNKKTKKCDCPAGTQKDSKSKGCMRIVYKTVCDAGYKMIAKNTCAKLIVRYRLTCPKGYKMKNNKCYKNIIIIKYQDPTPDPKESRIQCVMRFARTIKDLTTQKAYLNFEYTNNLRHNDKNLDTQRKLDKVNLLLETWVQGMRDCEKLEMRFGFQSTTIITSTNDMYMCGDFTCTKGNYYIWKKLIENQWTKIVEQKKTSVSKITQIKAQLMVIKTKKENIKKSIMSVLIKKKEVYMTIYRKSKLKNIAKAKCIKSKNTDKNSIKMVKQYATSIKMMIKEIHTLNKQVMKFMNIYVSEKTQTQKLRSEMIAEEEHLKIITIRFTAGQQIYEISKKYQATMKKSYKEIEALKRQVLISENPKAIKLRIQTLMIAYKKTAVTLWKSVQTLIDKSKINSKARQSQNWTLRSRTVDLERHVQKCQINMKIWGTEVSQLKMRRYKLLVTASGVSKPPAVPKKRLQAVKVVTKTRQGKHNTTVITKTKHGKLVHTKTTVTVKRGKYWKLNFLQVLEKINEYNMKILSCTATIKTLPVVIAKRQSYFRDHVDEQTACKSRKFKAKMVLDGKMGSYDGVKTRLGKVVAQLNAQIKKVANNKKAVNGLQKMKLHANHYKNDLAFKMWAQDFNMYDIRLMPCE